MRFMTSSFRALCVDRRCVKGHHSLQLTYVGGDGVNLRSRQIVRRRCHDGGCVDRRTLTSLLLPTCQLTYGVGIELARQSRNFILALALGAMTGGTCGNVGFGEAVLVDPFAGGDGPPWRPSKWFGIETPEMRGQGRQHRWAED